MRVKQLVSLLALSAAIAAQADPLKGENRREREERFARLAAKIAAGEQVRESEKPVDITEPLTLLGKRLEVQEYGISHKKAYFYFSTDGTHTNVVAQKGVPCCTTEELYEAAKVGDTKTLKQWQEVLKHSNERRCMGRPAITEKMEEKRHQFEWRFVREGRK